jgi:hypothetical protein
LVKICKKNAKKAVKKGKNLQKNVGSSPGEHNVVVGTFRRRTGANFVPDNDDQQGPDEQGRPDQERPHRVPRAGVQLEIAG